MPDEKTIETLNRLLDAEYTGFACRLGETSPFVRSGSAAHQALIERMIVAAQAHQRDLVETILALRGAPAPPRRSADTASIHYVELAYLMPQIVAAQREMIRVYESAAATGNPRADALVGRNLGEHRQQLMELEKVISPPRHKDTKA